MNNTGLVIFLLSALFTLSSGVSREFHFVNLKKNWTEAQSYCREHFVDLVTIDNAEDLARMQSLAESNGGFVWMGLYNDFTSWRWSMDNTSLYNDGKAEFSDWANREPSNYASGEYCGAIYQYQWHDAACETLFNSICYDERTDMYIPVETPMTWSTAQSFCRMNYTDLASIRSQQEEEKILNVTDPQSTWWIGLFRDSWKWSDQSDSSFRQWKSGQPDNYYGDEFCAFHDRKRAVWHDAYCYWQYPFICYSIPMLRVLNIELIPDTSVDLNNSTTQEVILEQIEKHMKDQGIHQTFRLEWRQQPDGKIFHKKKEEKKP